MGYAQLSAVMLVRLAVVLASVSGLWTPCRIAVGKAWDWRLLAAAPLLYRISYVDMAM